MTRLTALTPREAVAALKRAGFIERRQWGSHLHLWHPERRRVTTVPIHSRDLPRPVLKEIIRQAGLTEDEFRRLL